jgi:hypothetical protein
MKKLLIMALAALFCLALELPATAKVEVGGEITLDWTYVRLSPERAQGAVLVGRTPTSNGFGDMNFIAPITGNRLNARYTSDDGALVGFVELRGGVSGACCPDTDFWYLYIQWQITPTNRITFGLQTTNFARFWPNQWVGFPLTTMWGVNFGNVNHATTRPGIKGYWRISDMFGLVWGLWENEPIYGSAGAIIFIPPRGPPPPASMFVQSEYNVPRVDLALPIRFPWGRIEPSFTWSRVEFDQVPWQGDDRYDMYGVSLGGKGSWGMFSATAEITWGQNLGGGSYRGAETARPIFYVDGAGNTVVADAESLAWFLDVGFKFGRNTIDLMYGQIAYENDGIPGVAFPADPFEVERTFSFYGISWRIGVATGFTIRPELMFYDWDDNIKFNRRNLDAGKQWLLGVQFKLTF